MPARRFSPGGELLNPGEAVGEFVNTRGAGLFAGYYHDAAADASRMRDGMYWSGDLGYADSRGFCWFAGRAGGWLRVDGENLGTAEEPSVIVRFLQRGRDVVPERGRHLGSGGDDPAEPGHRSDH